MNWKILQWWSGLTPTNKLVTGLAIALVTVSTTLSGYVWNRQSNLVNKVNEKQKALEVCQEDRVKIVERLKDENIQLRDKLYEYDREKLERYEAQRAYQDSMNYILSITQRRVDKAIKNAKN